MTTASPESVSAALEASFTRIQEERMADIPVLNQALAVQAVGFMPLNENFVGILITPWFMNLMLLPREPESSDQTTSGTTACYTFPSGEYEFIAGEEADIGPYQMCSLYSPMFEFEDQEAATATARHVMEFLMTEPTDDDDTAGSDESGADVAPVPASSGAASTISRRELLRGALHEHGK